jgi:hypothetical protein
MLFNSVENAKNLLPVVCPVPVFIADEEHFTDVMAYLRILRMNSVLRLVCSIEPSNGSVADWTPSCVDIFKVFVAFASPMAPLFTLKRNHHKDQIKKHFIPLSRHVSSTSSFPQMPTEGIKKCLFQKRLETAIQLTTGMDDT